LEPLLAFWTWRLPLGVGLGLILLAVLAALRPPIRKAHVALVVAAALLAGSVFVWRLRAAATHLSMGTVASTLVVQPVPAPSSLLELSSDRGDPAGIATEDSAVVARYAACYEWRLPRYRAWESLRLTTERAHADADVPHPLLRVEDRGFGGFWYVEHDIAVLIWQGDSGIVAMRIRKIGDRYEGVFGTGGAGDELTDISNWQPIDVQQASCTAPRAQTPVAQPPAPTPLRTTVADVRNIGTAMSSWLVDNVDGANLHAFMEHETVQWSSCPVISPTALRNFLVPQYIQEVPARDGWGNPYEFCLRRSGVSKSGYSLGVRSPGQDGKFSTADYLHGEYDPADLSNDIVWLDGFFVRRPKSMPR
jgi:hypothetical protein